MKKPKKNRLMHHARTPRAAAIAGIIFGILFSISIVIITLALPASYTDMSAWTETSRRYATFALVLMPLAGLAFLWFVGVVRDRLGVFEDQFFAAVFQGSGLLFLAMAFCAFAFGSGLLLAHQIGGEQVITENIYLVSRSIISQLFNTYALKMASIFMISLSTLWLSTGVMPRALSFFTYIVAIVMFVSLSLSLLMCLLFPAWVISVSTYILILSFRSNTSSKLDGMTPKKVSN